MKYKLLVYLLFGFLTACVHPRVDGTVFLDAKKIAC